MPFQKIELDRVAESVITQIEQLILRGIIRPGERLPSERDLADRLGVSRPSLREASRSEGLETPNRSARSRSEGRRSPGLIIPLKINCSI